MFNKLKKYCKEEDEKLKEKINNFFEKDKNYQKSFIKKEAFGFLSVLFIFPFIFALIFTVSIFTFNELKETFSKKENQPEIAPTYLVEEFNEFKNNSILLREGILNYKVDKNTFYDKKVEQIKKDFTKPEIYNYEIEDFKEDLDLVNNGLFFVIEDKNSIELIATNNNGRIGYYEKIINQATEKEQIIFNEKIFNIEDDTVEKDYKKISVSKHQLGNKEILSIGNNYNYELEKSIFLEVKNNYIKNKLINEEYNHSVLNMLNGLRYESKENKLKKIYYYNGKVKDSFNNMNETNKDLEEALKHQSNLLNDKIDELMLMTILTLFLSLFFSYGKRRELKNLESFKNKEIKIKNKEKVEIINL